MVLLPVFSSVAGISVVVAGVWMIAGSPLGIGAPPGAMGSLLTKMCRWPVEPSLWDMSSAGLTSFTPSTVAVTVSVWPATAVAGAARWTVGPVILMDCVTW